MAIYTLGTSISQFKGSRDGATFQRAGTSFAIRSRKKPIFKRTPRTSQSRSVFHGVQSGYRLLSAGQKTSWADQAPNFQKTNSLGETYQLRPTQLFSAANIPLVSQGLPQVDTASSPITFPSISTSLLINFAPPTFEIIANIITQVPDDYSLLIFASPPMQTLPDVYNSIVPGPVPFNFYDLFKFIGGLPELSQGQFDITAAYRLSYPELLDSQETGQIDLFIVMSTVLVHVPTGQRAVNN